VELVRLYSNPLERSARLAHLRTYALSHHRSHFDTARTPQRVEQRLGHELISQIIGEYVSGMSSVRLAARYGIGKGTVLRLLREHGVVVRRRGPGRRARTKADKSQRAASARPKSSRSEG
jgi:hypothetical protein